MLYSEVILEPTRFMGTNDKEEYKKWVRILDENLIRYKVTAREPGRGKLDIRFELIGYNKEEIERIKDLVDYYYDEED